MLSSLPIIAGILSATFITAFGAPAASIDLVSNLVFPTAAYQDPNDEFLVVAEKAGSIKLFSKNNIGKFVLNDTLTVPDVFNHESHGLTAITVKDGAVYFGYSEALSESCKNAPSNWRLRRGDRDPKSYPDCVISGRIGIVPLDDPNDPSSFVKGNLVLTPMKNQHCMQFGESGIGGIAFAGDHLLVGYGGGAHTDNTMNDIGQYGINWCHSSGVFDAQDNNKFNGKIVSYRDGDLDDPVIIGKGLYSPWGLVVEENGGKYDVVFADNSHTLDQEEINRIVDVDAATTTGANKNFGFPCFQNDKVIKEYGFDARCAAPSIEHSSPAYAYKHPTRRGAIAGFVAGDAFENLYLTGDYLNTQVTVGGQKLAGLAVGAIPATGNYYYFTDPVTLTTYAVNQLTLEEHVIYKNALFTSLQRVDDELRGLDLISGKYISIGTKNA